MIIIINPTDYSDWDNSDEEEQENKENEEEQEKNEGVENKDSFMCHVSSIISSFLYTCIEFPDNYN